MVSDSSIKYGRGYVKLSGPIAQTIIALEMINESEYSHQDLC